MAGRRGQRSHPADRRAYEAKVGSRAFDDFVGVPMVVSGLKTLRETRRQLVAAGWISAGLGRSDGGKYLPRYSVGGLMKLKAAASLFLMALVVGGCIGVRGSGDVITIDVPVDAFSRLEVSHSFEVSVTVGDEPSLTLRVDDNLEASLDVGVTDGLSGSGYSPGLRSATQPSRRI